MNFLQSTTIFRDTTPPQDFEVGSGFGSAGFGSGLLTVSNILQPSRYRSLTEQDQEMEYGHSLGDGIRTDNQYNGLVGQDQDADNQHNGLPEQDQELEEIEIGHMDIEMESVL